MIALPTLMLSLLTAPLQDEAAPDFAHDVVPILRKHCVACHGGTESEGGFSLNTRRLLLDAEAAVPGKPDVSRMIELIVSADPDDQMPPAERPRLRGDEIRVLRGWVADGLAWEERFSFAPDAWEPPLLPRRPELPPIEAGRENPIDRLLDRYLTEHERSPGETVDDAAFLRRLTLDTLGVLPTPAELRRFQEDSRPDKRALRIDACLSRNRAYAEHWMTFWNDLLRNAYAGTGYIDGGRRQITGWLYASLLNNKPYDRLARELVAPVDSTSAGFIGGIKWRGNVNASQTREIQFSQSVAQVFLGINMKCASCHDSFIDRWRLQDAYGLAAVYATRPLEIHRCDKPTGRQARAAWIFSELGSIDADAVQPERLRQLAALLTHPRNGRFTRTISNRIWHRLMGRGIVHPVDAMDSKPWNDDLLDYLAVYLADHDYDLKALMRLILTSHAWQSRSMSRAASDFGARFVYTGPVARRLTAEQFLDAVRAVTGEWPKPGRADYAPDGRKQGGQLEQVLQVHGEERWPERALRAALTQRDPLQASLGRPNREQVVSMRPETLTTLEAIFLANDEVLDGILHKGAQRLLSAHGPDVDELIDVVYLRVLSRVPTSGERRTARSLLGPRGDADSVADLLWSVFMLPEFQLNR